MAYRSSTVLNHGQTANDADGIVTLTIPGLSGDIVLLGTVINNGSATISATDNGDAANPWTRLNTPNPDVLTSNTDIALFAKKLNATDVGKTVTLTVSTGGGIRFPVVSVAFSGRNTLADLIVQRAADTDGNNNVDPPDVTTGTAGYDICQMHFARVASAAQIAMSSVPAGNTLRAEAATAFTASPNYSVVAVSQDNVAAGTYGTGAATYNQVVTAAAAYTIALKQVVASNNPPTAGAGPDQINVEPGTIVTLSGTDSDSDGTIASRQWTQVGGTAVILSGANTATATFTAPATNAGDTLTFQYSVTDNGGATTSDTVAIQVLQASEYIMRGGVWIPTYWTKM